MAGCTLYVAPVLSYTFGLCFAFRCLVRGSLQLLVAVSWYSRISCVGFMILCGTLLLYIFLMLFWRIIASIVLAQNGRRDALAHRPCLFIVLALGRFFRACSHTVVVTFLQVFLAFRSCTSVCRYCFINVRYMGFKMKHYDCNCFTTPILQKFWANWCMVEVWNFTGNFDSELYPIYLLYLNHYIALFFTNVLYLFILIYECTSCELYY